MYFPFCFRILSLALVCLWYTVTWPLDLSWDAGSYLFAAFGTISAIISWNKFSGSSSFSLNFDDRHTGPGGVARAQLHSAVWLCCSHGLTQAQSPQPHHQFLLCPPPPSYGVCVLRLWISVIVCFSSNFPSGASLYFSSLWRLSFHLKHATIGSWSTFIMMICVRQF